MTRFSAKELLKQSHKKLNKKIRLFCDDKEINLPDLQGVLVLNIPSYAAGINFWGDQSGGTVRRNCTYVRT
jgi:diacylglycerol kinase (ATP)